MKIAAIIAEYNPFHNAHKKQLQTAKQMFDAVVVIMSGHLMQRGEFAIFNKWIRTKAAILCGADLVIEIPSIFSCASAEKFAHGAIKIVKELDIVDVLSFGSEIGQIEPLKELAIICKKLELNGKIKKELKKGLSYPKARSIAIQKETNSNLTSILNQPNNILGIEYIKASMNLKCPLQFHTIKRMETPHDCDKTTNCFASSKYIRNNPNSIKKYVPKEIQNLYTNKTNFDEQKKLLFFNLRIKTLNHFKKLPDVSEGLENRLFRASKQAKNLEEFEKLTKTKRYTLSRIRRLEIYSIMEINKHHIPDLPTYARILGFNQTGQKIASIAKKNKNFLFTSNFKKIAKQFPESAAIDSKATDILNMLQNKIESCGLEFRKKPIII